MSPSLTGGRLEDALTYYKRSKDFGVERAAVHIRNVRLCCFHHASWSASNALHAGQRQDLRQEVERDRKRSSAGAMNLILKTGIGVVTYLWSHTNGARSEICREIHGTVPTSDAHDSYPPRFINSSA